MGRLHFDPRNYQFYLSHGSKHRAEAKAAGFDWDALRNRYFTEDPRIAVGLVEWAGEYVRALLSDVLGELPEHRQKEMHDTTATPMIMGAGSAAIYLLRH
jgi:hypothetical protein